MRISLSPKKYFKAERYGPWGPLPSIAGLHERSLTFRPGSSQVTCGRDIGVFFVDDDETKMALDEHKLIFVIITTTKIREFFRVKFFDDEK